MNQIYVLILAGGNGERLWPLSTPQHPKQLLPLVGEKTLLDLSLERAANLTQASNIIVVTCAKQETIIRAAVGKRGQVVVEPEQKNTAPAILYACHRILAYDQEAIVVAMPADHFIEDNQLFVQDVSKAARAAKRYHRLVLLGITPTAPVTGYGYIQYYTEEDAEFSLVTHFHEKPRLEIAKKYLERNDMLWNSGIVIGSIQIFMEQFNVYASLLYDEMQGYLQGLFDYDALPSISFDYAVLEKTSELLVLPVRFNWSDVGDMRTFLHIKKDMSGNAKNVLQVDAENNLVAVSNQTVLCVGVDNLCVVQAGDMLVIVHSDKIDAMKEARYIYAQQQGLLGEQIDLVMPPQHCSLP